MEDFWKDLEAQDIFLQALKSSSKYSISWEVNNNYSGSYAEKRYIVTRSSMWKRRE